MALPAQIQKQAEEVQELYRKMQEDNTPPAEPQAEEPDAPAEPVTAPTAPPNQSADPELEALIQRYRTLQGMYNADVPRLNAQNKELLGRINNLENLLRNAPQPQPAPAPAQPQNVKYVTKEDEAEYGDSIEVMRKVTREIIEPMRTGYEQQISQLQGTISQMQHLVPKVDQIGKNQAASAEQQFWANLTYAVSNWREVNDDPDFQSWLLSQDPLTGISRQTYLEDAQRSLDVNRVAAFFVEWGSKNGSAPQPAPQPTPRSNAAQDELSKQISPGRGRTVETKQGAKKTYSGEEVSKFYQDISQGAYRGKDEERARIETDIFAATREGRITR